jgi:hypothetical protein
VCATRYLVFVYDLMKKTAGIFNILCATSVRASFEHKTSAYDFRNAF